MGIHKLVPLLVSITVIAALGVGNGSVSARAIPTGTVLDTIVADKDDRPEIDDQTFRLAENTPNGDAVGTIVADDEDDGEHLSFTLLDGGSGDTAFLVASSGDITVADSSQLDFETTPSFTIKVKVSDGKKNDKATITIDLNDIAENENQRLVVYDQSFSVAENTPKGDAVGTIVANNGDGKDALFFALRAGGTADTAFSVASSGAITVADGAQLDFEATPRFTIKVEVSDGKKIEMATITIYLNDVDEKENENQPPVIDEQTFSVAENAGNGDVAGNVVASDPDAGDIWIYKIVGGTGDTAFAIGGDSGEITVLDDTHLDFDTAPSFTLDVAVTDIDGLTDTAVVTVDVINTAVIIAVIITETGTGPVVSEDGAIETYAVVLTNKPSAVVNITLIPDAQVNAAGPSTNPDALVFDGSNYDIPQIVTVSAVDDNLDEGTHTGVIGHGSSSKDGGYNLIAIPNVMVLVLDNDRAAPDTVYVDDDFAGLTLGDDPDGAGPATGFGFDAFDAIQEGIDKIGNGTVNVAAGLYDEQLDIDQQIMLIGAGIGTDPATATIVRPTAAPAGGSAGDQADVDIDNNASDTVIRNFTFDFNGADGTRRGWGIVISDFGGPDLTGVQILDNEIFMGLGAGAASQGEGVGIVSGKNADVSGLVISRNKFHGDPANNGTDNANGGEGIYINPNGGSGLISITNNSFDGHLFAGISVESGNVTVSGNTVTKTIAAHTGNTHGIRINDSVGSVNYTDINIVDNNVDGFDNGLLLGSGSPNGSTVVISVQNNHITNNSRGIWVRYDAMVMAHFNSITGNTTGAEVLSGLEDGHGTLDAIDNWWGLPSGPSVVGAGEGDSVSTSDVLYRPWLLAEDGDAFDQTFVLTEPGEFAVVSAPRLLSERPTIEQDDPAGTGVLMGYMKNAFIGPGDTGFDDDLVKPVSAFMVSSSSLAGVGFRYLTITGPGDTSKSLTAEWNLIGTNHTDRIQNGLTEIQNTPQVAGMRTLHVPNIQNGNKDLGNLDWGSDGDRDLNANPFSGLTNKMMSTLDGYWVSMDGPLTYSKQLVVAGGGPTNGGSS